jgi:hypothetical protein
MIKSGFFSFRLHGLVAQITTRSMEVVYPLRLVFVESAPRPTLLRDNLTLEHGIGAL